MLLSMNKEGFTNARASIDYVYNLKNQLEKKISSRKIWNNSDKKELSAIRRESLRTLTALLEFCDIESSDLENAQASIVTDVRNKLSNILNEKNINSFSYSTFNLIGPALIDLFNYISAKQSSTSDQSKSRSVTFPVVALNKTEN